MRYAADASPPEFLTGWVGVVVTLIGLLGLLASAAAYLRASYAKATVSTLAESNAALSEQVRILKSEREDDERERVKERLATQGRLETLERENGTLREVVQGKADVERLVMLIQDHHHEVIEDRKSFHKEWRGEADKMQGTVDDVLAAVGEIATSTKAVRSMVGKVYATTAGDRT